MKSKGWFPQSSNQPRTKANTNFRLPRFCDRKSFSGAVNYTKTNSRRSIHLRQ